MTLTNASHTKQSLNILIFLFLFLIIKLVFGGMMVFLDPPDRAFFKEFWFLTLDWQVPSSGGIDSHHNAQYEQLRHHGGFTSGTCFHSDCNRRVEVTYSLWMLVVPLSLFTLPSWSETSLCKKRQIGSQWTKCRELRSSAWPILPMRANTTILYEKKNVIMWIFCEYHIIVWRGHVSLQNQKKINIGLILYIKKLAYFRKFKTLCDIIYKYVSLFYCKNILITVI